MRRRVIDEVGMIRLKDAVDAVAVADGTDQHDRLEARDVSTQLLLNLIGIILINIENNELFGLIANKLTAKFAADAAAAARDKDDLAAHIAIDM